MAVGFTHATPPTFSPPPLPFPRPQVLPQSQHMVFTPVPVEVPEVDSEDTAAQRTKELFRALDKVRAGERGSNLVC